MRPNRIACWKELTVERLIWRYQLEIRQIRQIGKAHSVQAGAGHCTHAKE